MKDTSRLVQLFVLAVFTILGSTWGVGRAHAETIDLFTGSWPMSSSSCCDFPGGQDQIGNVTGPLYAPLTGFFRYSPLISNYSEQGSGCDKFGAPCAVTWSGTFSGGTVSFGSIGDSTVVSGVLSYEFTGQITGGSFEGEMFCADECLGENRATFSFVSTSTRYFMLPATEVLNGWSSQGTFSGRNCVGQCGQTVFGTLTMTTSTVAEPGSMTLLGAGIAAITTLRRRRRSRVAAS